MSAGRRLPNGRDRVNWYFSRWEQAVGVFRLLEERGLWMGLLHALPRSLDAVQVLDVVGSDNVFCEKFPHELEF